jgi:y4mF family transcriptional regulator
MKRRNLDQLQQESGVLATFVRQRRKQLGYTQLELAKRIGVGLRFLKELELGKKTLRMDKVEQVLNYFGHTLTPTRLEVDHD